VLHEWGLRELADDASVVVSELITNAADASMAVPGHPAVALRLRFTGASVVVEVWDQCARDLEPREAGADEECGRGLTVVAALSSRWGWQRTGGRRKVVWAEL
jgi:anti-sigma regulatory factor (Ser/Thr protein kinase)